MQAGGKEGRNDVLRPRSGTRVVWLQLLRRNTAIMWRTNKKDRDVDCPKSHASLAMQILEM